MTQPIPARFAMPTRAPRDPEERRGYIEELKRAWAAGRLRVSFAGRPLPEQLLDAVLDDLAPPRA